MNRDSNVDCVSNFLSESQDAESNIKLVEAKSVIKDDESGVLEPISLRNTFESLSTAR